MSVEGSVNGLITDINQLNRLYQQLREVPQEVIDLIQLLADSRTRLSIASKLLAKASPEPNHDSDVVSAKALGRFRSRLLDFELMLDEEQFLHRSGPGVDNKHSVPWYSCSHGDYKDFCFHFKEHIFQLESDIHTLLLSLNARTRLTPDRDDVDIHNSASPSLQSLRSIALTNPNSRASTPGSGPTKPKRGSRKSSPRVKTEEEIIFDKFVAHYTKLGPQGKRKRASAADETQLVGLEALSKQLPFPFPAGQDDLVHLERQIRRSTNTYDNEDVPEWNLDDLRNALPQMGSMSPRSLSVQHNGGFRGKQRASAPSLVPSIEHSSSSSGSFRSVPREGSVFSVSSADRMYDEGHCKLWHHQGGSLRYMDIARTEIRREALQINGKHTTTITIVTTTPTGTEIKDPLWIPQAGTNSTPFLEHVEIVHAFQRRDPLANFIVHFAPNADKHPQYSFASREDCWDFLQSIAPDKILCASLDIESIKSAATHHNAVESGWETLQVWEDRHSSRRTIKFFRNKNEAARQRVVELDVACLRQPEKERKTGKLVTTLRDAGAAEAQTRDMKYLKIAFSNVDAEAGFMHECGFVDKEEAMSTTARFG